MDIWPFPSPKKIKNFREIPCNYHEDKPKTQVNITEHRAEEKRCPCCGGRSRASFPENIRAPVQYGDRIRALAACFSHEHFIPVDRVCEIFEDIFGVSLSAGTCANIDQPLFTSLEGL